MRVRAVSGVGILRKGLGIGIKVFTVLAFRFKFILGFR